MRALSISATGLAILILADACGQSAPEDMEKIQGSWQVTSFAGAGRGLPPDAKVIITADKLTLLAEGIKEEMSYTLDPNKKPKAFDAITAKKQSITGIYVLEGNDLKMCWDNDGKSRPTEFAIPDEKHYRLMVLKREKKK